LKGKDKLELRVSILDFRWAIADLASPSISLSKGEGAVLYASTVLFVLPFQLSEAAKQYLREHHNFSTY